MPNDVEIASLFGFKITLSGVNFCYIHFGGVFLGEQELLSF